MVVAVVSNVTPGMALADAGIHYGAWTIVKNHEGIHCRVDDSIRTASPGLIANATRFLGVLRSLPAWASRCPESPMARAWGAQQNGFECGIFALLHLEARLAGVWSNVDFSPATPEAARTRRIFIQKMLTFSRQEHGVQFPTFSRLFATKGH